MDAPKITLEELGPSRKRLQIEIGAPTVQAEVDRAFALVGRQARLPGFRPGKAPRQVLERMFGDQVRREVLGRLVEESFHHAVHEHQLAIVGTPEIDADVLTPGEALRYSATVDVRPDIVLNDLTGFEARKPAAAVTDDDVARVIESLRESVAQLRPITDRQIVEGGDVVSLNLSSRIEGAEPIAPRGGAARGRRRQLSARARATDRRSAPWRATVAEGPVSRGLCQSVARREVGRLRGRGRRPAREGASTTRR